MLWAGSVGLALLLAFGHAALRARHALHMLQLDSYANARLWRWLTAQPRARLLDLPLAAVQSGLLVPALAAGRWITPEWAAAVLAAWSLAAAVVGLVRLRRRRPAKKPLVYTGRATRILGLSGLLTASGLLAAGWIAWRLGPGATGAAAVLVGALGGVQLAPLAVILANALLWPVQATINARFLVLGRRRLREVAPTVVGITGSYGKTSTKYFTHTILAERYRSLMTPHSYNTLLGVCRTVNEDLRSEHQVFVVEMAAYRRGEITQIAEFARPRLGVLTAIGPQHLERFGSIEAIAAAKYELIAALPADGVAVMNADDPRVAALADRTTHVPVRRYGIERWGAGFPLRAEGARTTPRGVSFALSDGRGQVDVSARCIGRHNLLNILAAATVAHELGLTLEEIARGIGRIEPPPHRLQLLPGPGGVTVIDDAYNANPVGALEALEALRQFEGGRRILVTPGLVELGPLQAEANARVGRKAAEVCDVVILVGPTQTEPLRQGLEEAGFPRDAVHQVGTLADATAILHRLLRPGDTVLFENDLPDLYTEA